MVNRKQLIRRLRLPHLMRIKIVFTIFFSLLCVKQAVGRSNQIFDIRMQVSNYLVDSLYRLHHGGIYLKPGPGDSIRVEKFEPIDFDYFYPSLIFFLNDSQCKWEVSKKNYNKSFLKSLKKKWTLTRRKSFLPLLRLGTTIRFNCNNNSDKDYYISFVSYTDILRREWIVIFKFEETKLIAVTTELLVS